jgi:hypothetical protein
MTQKIRILTMVLLTLAMAGIGGAVTASAAARPARLAWSPTTSLGTYDYGTLATGTMKSVTFTLTNTGGKATSALRVTLSGPSAFTITQDGCSGSLGPNKSCTDTVQYAPTSSGQSDSATLTASGKAASANLTLSGTSGVSGTPTGNLTLSPGTLLRTVNGTNDYSYGFTHVLSGSKTTTFTVTNSGTSASQPLLIRCYDPDEAGCSSFPFRLTYDACTNTSLAPNGGSCTFDLVFYTIYCPANPPNPPNPPYTTILEVIGTNVTYIFMPVAGFCP